MITTASLPHRRLEQRSVGGQGVGCACAQDKTFQAEGRANAKAPPKLRSGKEAVWLEFREQRTEEKKKGQVREPSGLRYCRLCSLP